VTSVTVEGEASRDATPPRRRVVAVSAAAVTALVVVSVGWLLGTAGGPASTTFEVFDHGHGEVVYDRELPIGSELVLEHVHSVTGRPVQERFGVGDASTLTLEQLTFDEFGPNLPAGPDHVPEHASFHDDGGTYRIEHHGLEIGVVPLMVGADRVDHRLQFEDGERLRLLDVVRSGSRVELRVADR
jgi:hypothetical protein